MSDGLVIDRVSWHPRVAFERVDRGAAIGTRASGEILLERASERVPYDKGDLAGSGTIEESADGEVAVGYTDQVARFVHAHPEWEFQNGRSGRWLEEAMSEAGEFMADAVGEAIHRELGD